jgi:WD40 repeat protein
MSGLSHLKFSTRLASSLSPNGNQITAAKHGGYDLYSLESGIVLHTFSHGLHAGVDKYPTSFLPGGFAFCGATTDGTVTIWDVKEGDQLQSVQHLCAFLFSMFTCRDS